MMKTMLRRILFLILSFSLVLSSVPAFAVNEDVALFQTEAFNLFEKESDGTIDWSKNISRAEFAHVMAVILGHENDGVGYLLADVNENTPYRGDIYSMILLGLMSGDGNGCFRPNDNITLPEASTVFLRAMGYGHIISGKTYPQGVLSQAVTLNILRGISSQDGFTRRDFAMLLYNSLEVNLMSESYTTGEGKTYYKSDVKFGDVVFSANGEGTAYYGVGIVMQNAMSFVDVSYQELEVNQVIIDGVLYDTGSTNVAEFLGMEVRFLAKEKIDGTYVLMNITPTEKNDIVTFDASDFVRYVHNSYISYEDSNEKKRDIKVNSKTRIIKNYDVISVPSDAIFDIDCGDYTVVDNNNDNIADVIMIFSYENAVVSGVYNNVITIKEGFTVNGSRYLNLDEENDDLLYYVVDANGNIVTDVNTLSGGSVISVATDRPGKIMKIVVKEDALITNKLDAVGDGKFYIGENEYEVLTSAEYKIGNTYDFYLNFKGDIIYFEVADDGVETKYGYVLNVYNSYRNNQIELLVSKKVDFGIEINDDDADNVTQIPMLICQNEEIVVLDMGDKVRVDGEKIDSRDILDYISSNDQFYSFELDSDGRIKSMETANFEAGSLYQTFTYNIYDKCFTMGSTTFKGFAIDEKSQILCIPLNPTCDEDYMVKNVINKEGNTIGYYVRGYDYDPVTKKCGLVVINREMKHDNLPGVTVDSSKAAIVKNISYVLSEDDEYVPEVEFCIAGEERKMRLTDAAAQVTPALRPGDVFTFTEDYEDRISNFMIIRSMSKLTSDFAGASSLASGASETFGILKDISYDEVEENAGIIAMEFFVDVNGGERSLFIPQRNKPPIYIYNGKDDMSCGGMEDIVPGSDKVYVFMKSVTDVAAVVVVK